MDGSENITGATENLTSSTMGSVLVRNAKDSENTANDSLPSSSSDANTAAAAVITQDDPISSTSEDVVACKKVFVQQSDSNLDLQMDAETAQIAQQLDIGSAKDGSQTKNFEDIASELENLLEESAGDYKYSSKSLKNDSALDHKDINLDWDIDCEYSPTSKNSKLLDTNLNSQESVSNNKSIALNKVNIEAPSSSRDVLEYSEKNNVVESISVQNNIIEGLNSITSRTSDLTNDERNNSNSEGQSASDNTEVANKRDPDCPEKTPSNELDDKAKVTTIHIESQSYSPSVGVTEEIVIESKEVTEIAPKEEAVSNEEPVVMQVKVGSKDVDKINGDVESILDTKSVVMDLVSHAKTKIPEPGEDSNIHVEASASLLENTLNSCESIPVETESILPVHNDEQDDESSKLDISKQMSIENCTIQKAQQAIIPSEFVEENVSNLDTASTTEAASDSHNDSSRGTTLEMAPTHSSNTLKPVVIGTANSETTSVIETESLDFSENKETSILEKVSEESMPNSNISNEITPSNATTETIMESLEDSPVLISDKSETTLKAINEEANTSNLNTTSTLALETENIDSIDTGSISSSIPLATCELTQPDISLEVAKETNSFEIESENSKSLKAKHNSRPTTAEIDTDNTETFVVETVSDLDIVDNCDNYVASTVSTISVDSCVESDIAEVTPSDETKSTLPSTETASDSSALIFTSINSEPMEAVLEEYIEPSDQPSYAEGMYEGQGLVQDEDSYSQEQSFDSYEEQEEDTLESALIKAAVDAEHTRREITAKKQKEKEEEQAKLREQAEIVRKQREKNRLEAEMARKLLEEEEQRERDLLNRQIKEQQKLKEERRLTEERAQKKKRRLTEERAQEEERKLIEERAQEEEKRLTAERAHEEERRLTAERAHEEEKRLTEERAQEEENRLIAERAQEEEKRLTEERAQEEARITEQKILVDERKIIEEKKLAEQIKLSEKLQTAKPAIVVEYTYKDRSTVEKAGLVSGTEGSKTDVKSVTAQEVEILKPLNIEVEEQSDAPNITRDMEPSTKDGNTSEQPSESEEDNKPEYSSKMSQESLKMTITKHKTEELDTILKVYDPSEEDQTVRKLKIKPVVEENVKITFKNLHEKIPHSPKRSLRNLSPNRPQSPKVTIKPIKQESPLKITIKSVGRKSDEIEPTPQISPKITIKPIINNDEESFLGGKVKIIQKEEEEERLHSPKTYKNDSERAGSPKVTIRPVMKSENADTIPKLNIKLNKREQSPKHSSKNLKNRDEENLVEPLKLNIKQFAKDSCSISPKITFKPVMRPHESVHEFDDDHATQERIVLKINKSNYQVDSPLMRKREASEDIEKLAKIKLKVSKKPGHAHIVNEQMEALKRSLPEGIELVDIKKSKMHIPTHTQGGATITPIVMNEPTSQQEELSSDSVIFVSEDDSGLSNRDELTVTPIKMSSSHSLTPVTTPPPKRRGRPRKVPLEPRDVPIEEPTIPTPSENLLMITPSQNMSLLEGGHFLLSPTGSVSGGMSPQSETAEQIITSGRPKRSCRGPNAHTQLGIKPRKPRGSGRARGGRGRGHRGGLRGGGVDKPGKFERIPEPKLKLLKEAALSMKITDSFERQDIAIRIVDGIQEQCGIPTSGRRRGGGGHDDNSDEDDDGGNIISGGGGLEIIPRYTAMEEDEPMEMGTDPIKHGLPGKGRIGFLASGVIDITADDSPPPPEDEEEEEEMTGVEEVASSSSPPPTSTSALDRELKIVIGRNDQIGHELMMTKDIVIYEEETRMSADNGSRSGTPGKQVSPAVDPLAGIIDMAMPCEDTQSSMQSSGTTESAKVVSTGGATDASTSKGSTRRTVCRSDLSQDPDAHVAIISPDQLAEYHWQGDGPFMLQEQIAEYLGVKSFKRKYPHINRRTVDMQERDYIRDNALASEAMCNLGLTVLNSADVLDIMYSDFQLKYEEYCKHRRDKEAKEIMNRQRAINLAASQEKTKQDLVQTSITSAAQWNARFNRTRREQRPACMDLQTFTVNYAKGTRKVISRGRVGHYPLALVPGQYTDYYQTYTPTEISLLPFNTILETPISIRRDEDDSGSESDSSGSDSGSDSSSGSSGSSSSSSSDEDDKGQILSSHARSPVATTPSGKRLQAAA